MVPHRLEVEERDGYLYVVYGGDPLTLQMIVETINRVSEVIRSRGYTRVLLVRDAPLLESDASRALVANMIRNLVGENVRFAIVDVFGNHPDATARAIEGSRKAGWDLTGFETVEEAAAWLVKN
jgi:hypothetical protein